jgi:hypothetical protein
MAHTSPVTDPLPKRKDRAAVSDEVDSNPAVPQAEREEALRLAEALKAWARGSVAPDPWRLLVQRLDTEALAGLALACISHLRERHALATQFPATRDAKADERGLLIDLFAKLGVDVELVHRRAREAGDLVDERGWLAKVLKRQP